MNEVLHPNILELIQRVSTSDSNDINDKIEIICNDLIQATSMGESLCDMLENEKNISSIRIREYAILAAKTLKELSNFQTQQDRQKNVNNVLNSSINKNLEDKMVKDKLVEVESRFQKLEMQFANDIFSKINSTNLKISNMSHLIYSVKGQMDFLRNDNSNCRQMLSLIIQNLNGQNNNFQSLDSLLAQLGIKNSNIQFRLAHLLESTKLIKEFSETLHSDPQNIKNEITRLVEISKDSSKIYDSIPQIKEISDILHTTPPNIKNELNKLIKISSDSSKFYELSQQITEISEMLHTSPQNIKDELNRLIKISNDSSKLFESAQQIKEISEMLHTNPQNIKDELNRLIKISNDSSKLFESDQQIKEISDVLHTSPENIKSSISKLIEISKEASKPKPPPVFDTSSFENEISRLKRENQFLIDSKQQLANEKESLKQRVAIQQAQLAPKVNASRLSYTRYDYLASIAPVQSIPNNNATLNHEEFDEALKSKNNTIAQLNYELQNTLKSLKDMQENKQNEINYLRDQVSSLKIENDKKESKSRNQLNEIKELRLKIKSLSQSELVESLSNFFGGCSNEEEILNKVFNMKNEITKLKVKVSANEMDASNLNKINQNFGQNENNENSVPELKKQLDQVTDRAISLQEQVSALQSNNDRLMDDSNLLRQQIQSFRNNEDLLNKEIAGYKRQIRESGRTCERLQNEFSLSNNQLLDIKGKYELFERESEKLLTSINKLASKFASQQKSRKKQARPNVQNETLDNLQKMCEALQLVFMQYTMSDFSASEKVVGDLLFSIEQFTNNQNNNVLTNEITRNIIHKAKAFDENMTSKINYILQQFGTVHDKFDNTKNEIVQIIDGQQRDLQDYIENDYAPQFSSLKVKYDKLQEKYNAIVKNIDMTNSINDQFGQFDYQMHENNNSHQRIQSRFQSTPPRNVSRGSRSSIQSPSETAQRNYNPVRTQFYQ